MDRVSGKDLRQISHNKGVLFRLARKLLRQRRQLQALTAKGRHNKLSQKQMTALRSLTVSIETTKQALISFGADPNLLTDSKKLGSIVKASKGRMHMPPGRSGGVGVYGLKGKRKVWRE